MIPGADMEWRAVPWAPAYQVSSTGCVRKLVNAKHRERRQTWPMKLNKDRDGYLHVTINGGEKWIVHRLVYVVFLGPLSKELVVCHLNGDRQNNCPSNLAQLTQAENIGHKRIHGTWQAGETHPHAKHRTEAVRRARLAVATAARGRTGRLRHGTAAAIAAEHDVSVQLIYSLSRAREAWACAA